MTVQYVSNVYAPSGSSTTGGSTGSSGSSGHAFTVKFAEVLQDETLVNGSDEMAARFRDQTTDISFDDVADAASQGVKMSELAVATTTMTFTSMDDLRTYMATAMAALKRKEVMVQHDSPETDFHKISPLLRMTLLSTQDEATKTEINDFLAGPDAPTMVNVASKDATVSASGSSGPGKITVTLTQVLQDQVLADPRSDVAAKFADRSADLVFPDEESASQQGVRITDQVLSHSTKTFTSMDELRDFLSTVMVDLKRREIMAQAGNPENDTHKISPVLLMAISAEKPEGEQQVRDFMNGADAPKAVPVLMQGTSAAGSASDDSGSEDSPTKIPGGITVTFLQDLQDHRLLNPSSPVGSAFLDPASDLTFADYKEAGDNGVQMAEQTVGQVTKTFSDLNALRDYMDGLMTDLKRKEGMAQRDNPENDHHKISSVVRIALSGGSDEAETKVRDFLAGTDAPKLTTVFVEGAAGSGSSADGSSGNSTPTKIDGGITVYFEQVLQGQNLLKADSPLADEFKDPTVDILFDSKADALAQGISMKEQVVGKISKTFTDLDDLKDYMDSLMGNLKRTEVMAQHETPENDSFKISPMLRMMLSGASAESDQKVRDFIASADAPDTTQIRIAAPQAADAPLPGTIPGGIMIDFSQVLQRATLFDPAAGLADQFADHTVDVGFATADEALAHGVGMSEQTLASATKVFKTTDELRDYLAQVMYDLKRKDLTAQLTAPNSDTFKVSPVLRMTLSGGSAAAKQAVLDFLGDEDTEKLVPLLVDDGA